MIPKELSNTLAMRRAQRPSQVSLGVKVRKKQKTKKLRSKENRRERRDCAEIRILEGRATALRVFSLGSQHGFRSMAVVVARLQPLLRASRASRGDHPDDVVALL